MEARPIRKYVFQKNVSFDWAVMLRCCSVDSWATLTEPSKFTSLKERGFGLSFLYQGRGRPASSGPLDDFIPQGHQSPS